MLQKNELDRARKLWGPIGVPVGKKAIESWGRVGPESVIDLYNRLGKDLSIMSPVPLKHKETASDKRTLAHQ